MTSPGPECTYTEPEKRKVWPNGDRPPSDAGSTGKVTGEPGLQSAWGRISSFNFKIIVLF